MLLDYAQLVTSNFLLAHFGSHAIQCYPSQCSAQTSLLILALARSAESKITKKRFHILLIQSMKNFSLTRTTVGDCYRIVVKRAVNVKKKKKSNETKSCQDF